MASTERDPENPDGHNLDSPDCWCVPDCHQVCPVCNGDRCEYCNGEGWVPPYNDEAPMVIVHHNVIEDPE